MLIIISKIFQHFYYYFISKGTFLSTMVIQIGSSSFAMELNRIQTGSVYPPPPPPPVDQTNQLFFINNIILAFLEKGFFFFRCVSLSPLYRTWIQPPPPYLQNEFLHTRLIYTNQFMQYYVVGSTLDFYLLWVVPILHPYWRNQMPQFMF